MRIKNTLVNLVYIWGSALLLLGLNLLTRRIFLDVLVVDYLGYDGLFSSIFSFLTLSEMGIAGIITYHMYSEIATNNTQQIRKLLYIYKMVYKIVGGFVLVAGIVACFFLPYILKEQMAGEDRLFIYTIYFLQLFATICTYFLAYRRILFVTHQKIYFCTMVDTVMSIAATLLKIFVLLKFQSYIGYLLVSIVNNVISNLIIAWWSRKKYPEITRVKITKADIKELNLWHDVKNMMATKVAITIYGSSSDIIITAMLGVRMDGLVSNYGLISAKIQEFILSIFKALQASIGNLVYDDEEKKGIKFFKALDLVGFYMGLTAATGIVIVGQDFILWWLKKTEFQLPVSFLIVLSVNIFIAICNNPMNYFRNTFGHFGGDRNYMIAAAIVNIIISLMLTPLVGVTGVMIGTVVGHLLIYLGRTVVVYKYYIKEKPYGYYLKFLLRLIFLGVTVAIAGEISSLFYLEFLLGDILVKGIISVIISSLVFFVFNFRSEEFRTLMLYAKTIVEMILKKRRSRQ